MHRYTNLTNLMLQKHQVKMKKKPSIRVIAKRPSGLTGHF